MSAPAARTAPPWRALVVFTLAAGAAVALAHEGARVVPRGRALEELAYYPSGRWLQPFALGERATLADLTWLRAVQYYGEHRGSDGRFALLAHVLDIVTSLDGRHRNAYVFGGTALAQEGQQFEAGVALLEKGRARNPDTWVYPFEIGFLTFVEKRDSEAASQWFREAVRKPDCPDYVRHFAAYTSGKAGYVVQAVALWQRVAEETPNRVLREKAVAEARRLSRGSDLAPAVERWAGRLALDPLPGEGG